MRGGMSTLLYSLLLSSALLSLSKLPNILLGSRVWSWGRKKQVSLIRLIEEKRFFYFLLGLSCPDRPWSNYCRFLEWERSNHYSFFPLQMNNYHMYYSKHTQCCLKLPVIAYLLTLLDAQMLRVTVTLAGDFQYVELRSMISIKLGDACYVFLVAR